MYVCIEFVLKSLVAATSDTESEKDGDAMRVLESSRCDRDTIEIPGISVDAPVFILIRVLVTVFTGLQRQTFGFCGMIDEGRGTRGAGDAW